MTRQRWISQCGAAAIVMAFASAAAAQMNVTTSDIQRLQDDAYQAGADVSRLRSTDPNLAAQLQTELDDLRDEVVYLKVKLRKEGSVSRNDYADVRDRIQDLRSRARGDSGTARQGSGTWGTGTSGGVSGGVVGSERPQRTHGGSTAIASGQEIDVRLEGTLDSGTAQVEQRFQATTVVDLYRGNDVLIPAGSMLRGVISSVTKATRTERKGSMTISFDQITIRGRAYPMRGIVTQAIESEGIKGEATRIGAGAGVGAIIGGIIGGVKGALLGVLIGGGTIAATEGKDVTLPAGTILRVRLDQPPGVK